MSAMPDTATPLVLARVLNLVHPATPWHRLLWSVSSHTGIAEVVEYAEVAEESKGKVDGLAYAAQRLIAQIQRDPGVGSQVERDAIVQLLTPLGALTNRNYPDPGVLEELKYWGIRTKAGYFTRWGTELEGDSVHVERSARLVASALLDSGFSVNWIVSSGARQSGETATDAIQRVLSEASQALSLPSPQFTVGIPLDSVPLPLGRWEGFAAADDFSAWLGTSGVTLPKDHDVERRQGGFIVTVEALDPHTAVDVAMQQLSGAFARHALSHQGKYRPRRLGFACVIGQTDAIRIHDSRLRVSVPALQHPPVQSEQSAQLNNAVDLAWMMEEANPAVVVSAGWAAIEGLLVRGGEPGVTGADRMASIVACSWARNELVSLGVGHFKNHEERRHTREMAASIESLVRQGGGLNLARQRDQAGLLRIEEAVQAPHAVLRRIREYAQDAFRRLYNQRNLAMHRGIHRSPGLEPTVRTVPPLVGAGLDRIAAAAEHGISPVALAARADIELSLLGQPGGRSLSNLLDFAPL